MERINKRFVAEVREHLEPVDVLEHFPFLSGLSLRKKNPVTLYCDWSIVSQLKYFVVNNKDSGVTNASK